MESLLANYGSDEEDGDASPEVPKPSSTSEASAASAPSWNRQSIFGSLPPPKNADKQSSLWDEDEEDVFPQRPFKNPITGDSGKDRDSPIDRSPKLKNETNGEKKIGISSTTALPSSRPDSAALPSDFFSNSSTSSPVGEDSLPLPDFSERPQVKSGSLFSRLPPPVSSRASGTVVPPHSSTAPAKKKIVDFRPHINLEALRVPDDDELTRNVKPGKTAKDVNKVTEPTAATGLFALLPPPKNSLGAGVGLGGGGAHGGRRTIMETSAVTTAGMAGSHLDDQLHHNQEERELVQFKDTLQVPPERNEISYHSDHHSRQFGNPEQPYAANQFDGHDRFLNNTNTPDWHSHEGIAPGPGSESTLGQGSSAGVLAAVMKKERKRGREVAPEVMMEVKQADLTGGPKLRQDQLRATGIAFGPSYQPASSSKDKPSKLHRRKHQLGALYYDMKQNEMNLMERRAKGHLTKAETQAKYGW